MAALSVLRAARSLQPILFKQCLLNSRQPCTLALRQMSERRMQIKSSSYAWHLFKDKVHFYLMLGVIPLGTLIFLVNVFIGPPELAEIPEGYEPKPWEYFNHPIKRFFARYVYPYPQQNYEKMMHYLQTEHERVQLRAIEEKVRFLMKERGDYQSWYYIPYESKYTKADLRDAEANADAAGDL
ncbi:NADH dehydrogenase [ubiquinone] 1 beta subcomplex subunit 5, mitochondrial-like [Ornithodoros turicata]|uniref:NADH dehydrogenase [ubiquinone] 1 beta subcomplex subunit 5, mitochondrial-like n=1 Tax=Ornithodoros turicata TaxID=34597 RepID=UPI0031397D86